MMSLSYLLIAGSILLSLLTHLLPADGVQAALSEGPSDRIPLYLDSLTFPCSDRDRQHPTGASTRNGGHSTQRGHDNNTKDVASTSSLASVGTAFTGSNRGGASRDEISNEVEDDGERKDEGSLCRITNVAEHSVLSVLDCSACSGSQQLIVYDQGTNDILVQVNDFCAKCETFSFVRGKEVEEGRSVSLLVEQRCVDINPSLCQRSQTIFNIYCGYGWYRPKGYAGCLPCPLGMSTKA
jgi:hypothetical protein